MGILAWIVLGVLAGLVGKALMPEVDPGGVAVTVVLGIVGAVLAGAVGLLLGAGGATSVSFRSMLAAVAGAVVVLAAYRFLVARRSASWD